MNTAEKKLEENLLAAKNMNLPNKRSRYFYKSELKIPKQSLVLLCGIPGAGKTTLAQEICTQSNKISHIDIDYMFDCTTKELYPNAVYLTEENIDCIAKEAFDKAYRNVEKALAKENAVVWDDLGIFPTDRADVLNALKNKYTNAILIVVTCNKLKAICRSISRGDTQTRTNLILDTDIYLQLQLQQPTKYFRGFNEVYIIDETQKITVKEP